jgi:hypothetical protein
MKAVQEPEQEYRQLTKAEWTRRLREVKSRAAAILAHAGLEVDRDDHNPAGELFEADGAFHSLDPCLWTELSAFETRLEATNVRDLSGDFTSVAMAMVDAAYLFGVIAGTQVSWEMVEAIEPPSVPVVKKRGGR